MSSLVKTTAAAPRRRGRRRQRGEIAPPRSARQFFGPILVVCVLGLSSFAWSAATGLRLQREQRAYHDNDGGGGAFDSKHVVRRDFDDAAAHGLAAARHVPEPDCREVHHAADKCAFVRDYCLDDEAGMLGYLTFYYCTMGAGGVGGGDGGGGGSGGGSTAAMVAALAILALWLGLLFTTIGIAASDFFSVNLSTIATVLGLSESLAGVTFLAFGNGSPDVFSTFAAMQSNSGAMAVGELIGAAGFITAVVAGSMALVSEFRVSRKTFVRDICFFIAAISFSVAFLSDGELHMWECAVMIGFYGFYVVTVVGWHYVATRRKRRRQREAASRAHVYGAGSDELEPYRDDADDDEDRQVQSAGPRSLDGADIDSLERGQLSLLGPPRIEFGGGGSSGAVTEAEDDDDDEERRQHVAAEMASSMRVLRPRGRRSTTTITPIRPSLVGALEFRSVLASLQKERRHVHLATMQSRSHSENHLDGTQTDAGGAGSGAGVGRTADGGGGGGAGGGSGSGAAAAGASTLGVPALADPGSATRDRALSIGDTPLRLTDIHQDLPGGGGRQSSEDRDEEPGDLLQHPDDDRRGSQDSIPPGIGVVAPTSPPPPMHHLHHLLQQRQQHGGPEDGAPRGAGREGRPQLRLPLSPSLLQARIPSPHGSGRSSSPSLSPSLSAFPGLSDSPMPMSPAVQPTAQHQHHHSQQGLGPSHHYHPHPHPHRRHSHLARPSMDLHQQQQQSRFPGIDDHDDPKPIKWWPYRFLPSPHELLSTLFPAAYDWHERNLPSKIVGAISIPSVLLLVLTLPVVETERREDESDGDDLLPPPRPVVVDLPQQLGDVGRTAPPGAVESEPILRSETEWQQYRRSTRSHTVHHGPHASPQPSPMLLALDGAAPTPTTTITHHSSSAETRTTTTTRYGTIPSSFGGGNKPPVAVVSNETTSVDEPDNWNRWLVSVQAFTGPQFVAFIAWANLREDLESPGRTYVRFALYALVTSLILLGILLATTTPDRRPRYHYLLCFGGFVVSVAWISTVAGEVVGVLKAVGVILNISEAILGLTVFAVGNSLGDLVANVTVARLGYSNMALAACFGGPMLNILLGIGIGGMVMTVQAANDRHARHPKKPVAYRPYRIQVGGTLLVSAVTLLVTLVALLVVVPANRWVMSRKIGFGLIALWSVGTVLNLVIETTGFWRDVA